MIFYLLEQLGIPLTKDMATNLYAALAIDTGTFRYSNTNSEVLSVAAQLVDAGADPAGISVKLYETWTRKRFSLLSLTLNTLEIRNEVAIVTVTKDMFEQTGTVAEDTETFVGFPRMMDDIAVSALFRQDGPDLWKVSLRSKGKVNVAEIASQFRGGGHRNAAGYQITGDIEIVKEALMRALSRPMTG
jgi:phosphoesterase RecJ-like protein